MANTTNFGWETPDDTDLVKDGALAMRTLGNAIDTSLVDLKGGTTGQVLSKNTNTDMDFTWVTPNDADAIQNSIVDAKGDLIAASANDTPARLAVGNNGETLVADSSTSTGLRWQVPVNVNPVINSAFQVWQRGTSISVTAGTNGFTADRWFLNNTGNACTISRQATGDTTNLPHIQYCARIQRNSGQTAVNSITFTNSFETINSIPYAGKTVTFSFYARKGADFSGGTTEAILITGTGTDQNRGATSYTGQATPISISMTSAITTTWQRFTGTATLATNITELATYFYYTPSGTAGANDYLEITGVQLEIGSVATPFKTYAGTLAGELAACQRYYQRFGARGGVTVGAYQRYGSGYVANASFAYVDMKFAPPMRVAPTSIDYANVGLLDSANAGFAISSITLDQNGSTESGLTVNITGGTTGRFCVLNNNNNTGGYVAFNAEL